MYHETEHLECQYKIWQMLLSFFKTFVCHIVSYMYVSCGHLVIDYVGTGYVWHEAEQLKSSKCVQEAQRADVPDELGMLYFMQ